MKSSQDHSPPAGVPVFASLEPTAVARCEPAAVDGSELDLETHDLGSEPDLATDALLRQIAHSPPRRPRSAVAPGTQWGHADRFIIRERLGRGGMGTVYAATDTMLGRVVALKLLDAGDASPDPAHHARLLREAQLAAKVEHERIARVYDVGTHDGLAFVAMEHVPGGTLRQRMQGRTMPVPQIVDIATQIAEGLAELHAKGVIHRDLKPENVMFTAQGGVKLLDFGLARHALAATDEPGSPARYAVIEGGSVASVSGTPGYMAPEQYSGQPIDARVDIFALGVIIDELVTGERLFRGATQGAIMRATLEQIPALSGDAWARAPGRLRDHTQRMLARDPADRFADGSRAVAALRELTGEMADHRAPPPAAIAQAIGNAPTRRAISLRLPWRLRLQISVTRVVMATVILAIGAVMAYRTWDARPPAVAALLPPPAGMSRIDAGAGAGMIEVGRNSDEIDRECRELGSGCNPKHLQREVPRSRVTVPPFNLDQREVSNAEFAKLLGKVSGLLAVSDDEELHYPRYVHLDRGVGEADPIYDLYRESSEIVYDGQGRYRPVAGREQLPVSHVSWFGAKLYCETLGKRLPTEDEWEAAARGRSDRRFPWGNEPPRCGDVVTRRDGQVPMSGDCPVGAAIATRPVGSAVQDVTPDGVHDLGGNLSEWTSTLFVEGSRAAHHDSGPRNALRVIRGGSWAESGLARTSARTRLGPLLMTQNVGFRCASDAEPDPAANHIEH